MGKTMMNTQQTTTPPDSTALHWVGVIMIAIGILAFMFLGVASLVVEYLVGASFLMTGLVGAFAAYFMRHTRVFLGAISLSVLSLLLGSYLIANPTSGMITLTVLICVILFIEGLFHLALAIDLRPWRGWKWMLGSALISFAVGSLVLVGLPGSSRLVLGALLGFSFLSTGIAFIRSAERITYL